MNEPEDDATNSETGKASNYTYTHLPEGGHIRFRKCAACGAAEMKPESAFTGSGLGGFSDRGLNYRCPDCNAQARVWDPGAIFMGSLYSLFWAAIGVWAFHQGPLWYLRHLSYFIDDGINFNLLMDIGSILLGLAVTAFSGWVIWTNLLAPLKTLIQHPVSGENRAKTQQERAEDSKAGRAALMSFFVCPLLIWVPLLGTFWGLDALGADVQGNEFIKYGVAAVVLGLAITLGKRFGANLQYAFVGMAFWLAIFVAVVFTVG